MDAGYWILSCDKYLAKNAALSGSGGCILDLWAEINWR